MSFTSLLTAVALTVSPPQTADEPVREPAAEPPARGPGAGLALAITGAVAGGLGLGLGIAGAHEMAALEDCPTCPRRLPPMVFAAVALNTSSLALTSAGCGLLGRWHGERDANAQRAARAGVPWIALGGLVTASGVLLVTGALTWRFLESPRISETPWALLQGGMSTIVAGSGLLVYGLSYRRVALERAEARLRVVPQLGWQHYGVGLVGRF